MWGRVLPIKGMHDQPTFSQTKFFNIIFTRQNIYVPLCSHSTEASTICSYLSLYQQWNPIPSSCLVPTYPVQSSCVLKGWLYSLLLYDFTEPLLPAFEAGKSWPKLRDPCCKPQSGQDLSPTTRTLPSLSYPSTFFLLLHATGTNLCELNRFSGHFWGTHKAARLFKLTWGYLSRLRPLKINKRTEALSLVKRWDFRGRGKQQLPKALWTLSAEWELSRGRALCVNKQNGDTICRTVDIDERE